MTPSIGKRGDRVHQGMGGGNRKARDPFAGPGASRQAGKCGIFGIGRREGGNETKWSWPRVQVSRTAREKDGGSGDEKQRGESTFIDAVKRGRQISQAVGARPLRAGGQRAWRRLPVQGKSQVLK